MLISVLIPFLMQSALAAVSCTLDFPDRDVRRLYPGATTYKVRELLPFRHGVKGLMETLKTEMEGELDEEFETKETPYTFYVVYKESQYVGLLLGLNARAVAGPMQIFVAYYPTGRIRDVYVQKISSKDAPAFRSKYYREQYRRYGTANLLDAPYAKPPVRSPSPETIKDHHAFVRAVRLNILLVKNFYNKFSENPVPAPTDAKP